MAKPAHNTPQLYALDQANKNILLLESVLVPYEKPQNHCAPSNYDFDILELLADVDTDDNELIMAATQVEAQYQDEKQTKKSTSLMARRMSPKKPNTGFTGCKFGNVGTINIHIHKH